MTLDTVIAAFLDGNSAEEIVAQYPSLNLADVDSVIDYYLHHRQVVDQYLQQREIKAAQVKQANEEQFNPIGLWDPLIARQSQRA
ncbi:DUF433 domain-containing protein [Thermosynechococcaceae cyanobacterium BACA0444]|uniref:DUF433 domain-containing protein n=1 Tax=Pseudocalidococcus azoricus BACA0444 TaxID=2918990 RepID=A0AAE4FSL2_9CYAN|nr:DUF433 domain-containing protein [Pseudocalidococcus azoricus]MDS3860200.1 DUF433 domain-containing protein [Pseudocalidococcus azoricus BACA0444]